MTTVNDALEKLREDYRNKIPSKIEELVHIWHGLLEKPDKEALSLFHLKVHSLHGTSGTYGYIELSKVAAQLESVLRHLLEQPEQLDKNKNKITELLNALQVQPSQTAKQPEIEVTSTVKDQVKHIYLLENDALLGGDLITQLTTFGYQIQSFNDTKSFIDQCAKQAPALFIININLLDKALDHFLKSKNTNQDQGIPVIFLSGSGEFSLRLQAVRLGGEAFFIKPFLIDRLIACIERLLKSESEVYRILIIDDEQDVANYYAAMLQQANMKTAIINRSAEIDRALHEFSPDLILMDLLMPECSGLELAKIIRQQTAYQSIPIVYLSAEEDQKIQLNAMKLGGDDFVTKASDPIYLVMTIKNKVERYKKLLALTVKDNLTGLYNHSFILKQLEIELKESIQLHNPLSIAVIDLDRCKNINETYGHQAGDHVLKSLALMLSKRLRPNDIIGRYEGKSILVILPNTSAVAAKTVIDDLRKHFMTLNYSWNQQIFNATFSAAIAAFPDFHTTAELLEAANESILKCKKAGRNRVEVTS